MSNDKKIIEKQKEIINLTDALTLDSPYTEIEKIKQLKSELTALESRDSEGESAEEILFKKGVLVKNALDQTCISIMQPALLISAMEEYAQSKQKEPEKVILTDEEIETEAEEYAINNFVGLINQDIVERIWIEGAKWYRDQLSSKAKE